MKLINNRFLSDLYKRAARIFNLNTLIIIWISIFMLLAIIRGLLSTTNSKTICDFLSTTPCAAIIVFSFVCIPFAFIGDKTLSRFPFINWLQLFPMAFIAIILAGIINLEPHDISKLMYQLTLFAVCLSLLLPILIALLEPRLNFLRRNTPKIINFLIGRTIIPVPNGVIIYTILIVAFGLVEVFNIPELYTAPHSEYVFNISEGLLKFKYDIDTKCDSLNSNCVPIWITPGDIVPSLIGSYITVYVAFITFILVAVQLSSSQFSPRILKMIFPRDPQIFFMSVYFLLCISYLILLSVHFYDASYRLSDVMVLGASAMCIPLFFNFIVILVDRLNITNISRRIKERTIDEINGKYNKHNLNLPTDNLFRKLLTNHIEDLKNRPNLLSKKEEFNQERLIGFSPIQNIAQTRNTVITNAGFIEDYNPKRMDAFIEKYPIDNKYCNSVEVRLNFSVGQFIHVNDVMGYIKVNNPKFEYLRTEHEWDYEFRKISKPESQETYLANTLLREMSLDIQRFYKIDTFRSFDSDIQFGIRQLVDVAIKSVSPAINDPTTCITCIYNITDILVHLLEKEKDSKAFTRFAENNIIIKEFDFTKIMDQCFDQIYTWSRNDVDIIRNIVRGLKIVSLNCSSLENLKTVVDEMLDLLIFETMLEPLLGIERKYFPKEAGKINDRLTEEAIIILAQEYEDFCRAVFSMERIRMKNKHDFPLETKQAEIEKVRKSLKDYEDPYLQQGANRYSNSSYFKSFNDLARNYEELATLIYNQKEGIKRNRKPSQ